MGLYAFDGTWNAEKTADDAKFNTNVVRFKDAYEKNDKRKPFYVSGVGTRMAWLGKAIGGVFGAGELPRLNEAYKQLCQNWDDGDTIIDIVGFSRGAATTLDFCHMIQDRGIERPDSDTVVDANPRIRFLGVWDIVPAFGLGFLGNEALNFGHKLTLPTKGIDYCFHALALDERRISFLPIRLDGACEVWFRGVHSDIGGGNGNLDRNDISLMWMMSKAQAAGLPIGDDDLDALDPNPNTPPQAPPIDLPDIRNIGPADLGHYTVDDSKKWRHMPAGAPIETPADEVTAKKVGAAGISALPEAMRRRAEMMWDVAVRRARDQHHVSLDPVQDPLLALIVSRAAIVNNQNLNTALEGTVTMVDGMMTIARQKGWGKPAPVLLNEALQKYRPVFPYTN